jgi:hypothetical protein
VVGKAFVVRKGNIHLWSGERRRHTWLRHSMSHPLPFRLCKQVHANALIMIANTGGNRAHTFEYGGAV